LSQGGKKNFFGFLGCYSKIIDVFSGFGACIAGTYPDSPLRGQEIFIGVLEKSCKDWFLFCVRYLRQSGISDFLLLSRKSLSRPCGDFNDFTI